jgi:hypothetical protein
MPNLLAALSSGTIGEVPQEAFQDTNLDSGEISH